MIKRLLYFIYLIEWKIGHKDKAFKGCSPVCFNEWCDCELYDMMQYPQYYDDLWYYPLVNYLRKRN